MLITGEKRDKIAEILEQTPHNLDAAIDAIGFALGGEFVQKIVDEDGHVYWMEGGEDAAAAFSSNIVVTQGVFIAEEES